MLSFVSYSGDEFECMRHVSICNTYNRPRSFRLRFVFHIVALCHTALILGSGRAVILRSLWCGVISRSCSEALRAGVLVGN